MSEPLRRLALVSLLLMPAAVLAEPTDWFVAAGLTHYDNINLVPDNGLDDTVANVRAVLKYEGQGARHAEHLWAAGTYYNYLDNTYDARVIRSVAGDVVFQLVPDVVSWTIEDNYGPTVRDPRDSSTPDNLAYVNYFSTGPQLTLGAGRRTRMVFDGRYGTTTFNNALQESNTNQISGDLALVRQVSTRTAWSLHAGGRQTDYVDPENEDYDVYKGYVRYDGGSARSSITADVGISRLEVAGDSRTTPLFGLSLNRQLSKLTSFAVSFRRDYADTADQFRRLQNAGGATNGEQQTDVTTLAAPLREDYVIAALKVDGRRTTAALGGSYSESNFESDTTSDLSKQQASELYVLVTRQLNDFLSLSVRGSDQRTKYQTAARKDRDNGASAALAWKLGHALSLVARYQYLTRNSTDNRFDYDATIIGLWLGYSPGGRVWTDL